MPEPGWSAAELALLQRLTARLLEVPADAEPEVLAARLVLARVLREAPDVTRLADALSKVAAVLLGDRKLDIDAARAGDDDSDLEAQGDAILRELLALEEEPGNG